MNKYVRDVVTFPRDVAEAWAQRGARGVWRELRLRTLDRLVHTGVAVVLEHDKAKVLVRPLPEGVRVESFAGPDWSAFRSLVEDSHIERFRERVARGRTCLVAWRGEQPVGYTWVSTCVDPAIEKYRLPLPNNATYHWDLFVDRAERGSGVARALSVRSRHFKGDEFRVGWRLIDIDNHAALRHAVKTAAAPPRTVGELRFLHTLGLTWSRFTPETRDPRTVQFRATLESAR